MCIRDRCSFSSTGPQVELAAPGAAILSTMPNGTYARMSGTSMSAPHVAGVAALALAVRPGLANADLRALLQTTARDLGAEGRDASFGFGVADARALLVAAATPENRPPVASFTYVMDGLTARADGRASFDPDGAIVAYRWDWGDGATSTGPTSSVTVRRPARTPCA